ncbi:MAG: hypothetical protein AABN95_26820 [Acidobacteriota bacterium]
MVAFAPKHDPQNYRRKIGPNNCGTAIREPEHWYPDEEGAPFTHHTGGYWYDDKGQMNVEVLEGTKPYETFSDDTMGLSVRAAFLRNVNFWVVADRLRSQ